MNARAFPSDSAYFDMKSSSFGTTHEAHQRSFRREEEEHSPQRNSLSTTISPECSALSCIHNSNRDAASPTLIRDGTGKLLMPRANSTISGERFVYGPAGRISGSPRASRSSTGIRNVVF